MRLWSFPLDPRDWGWKTKKMAVSLTTSAPRSSDRIRCQADSLQHTSSIVFSRLREKQQITGDNYSQDLALWWVLETLTRGSPVTKSSANDLAPRLYSWWVLVWRRTTKSSRPEVHFPGLLTNNSLPKPKPSRPRRPLFVPPKVLGAECIVEMISGRDSDLRGFQS